MENPGEIKESVVLGTAEPVSTSGDPDVEANAGKKSEQQPAGGRYADYFWGDDEEGHYALKMHAERSEESLCNVYQILRTKAKLDEKYGKDLLKLLKSDFPEEDAVGLSITLDTYKRELSNTANYYLESTRAVRKNLIKPFSNFIEYQSMVKKNKAASAEKELRLMKACLKRLNATREKILKKRDKLSSLKYSASRDPNDSSREKKAKSAAKLTEYINSLEADFVKKSEEFKVFRGKWITAHTVMCQTFQKLDVDRYAFVINYLHEHSNIQASLCSSIINCYDRVKSHLSACSFDKDNDIFLKLHGTGTIPQDYSKYLNHYLVESDDYMNTPKTEFGPLESCVANNLVHALASNSGLSTIKTASDKGYSIPSPLIASSNTDITVLEADINTSMTEYDATEPPRIQVLSKINAASSAHEISSQPADD